MRAHFALATALIAVGGAALAEGAAWRGPTVTLRNTAVKGLTMPAVGLGTGGYGSNASAGFGAYPECWSVSSGCGDYVYKAVRSWLSADVGGQRLDCATSYQDQVVVGKALHDSGVPRDQIFLLSKVGPSQPLGYHDALSQFDGLLSDMGVDHVDALLIHWPDWLPSAGNVTHNTTAKSTDPACNRGATYNATKCRLDTWRALLKIYGEGKAKAIGVSNYWVSDLQEIIDAGLPLPSINQSPFHIYRSSTQAQLRAFCEEHNITFVGYSPLGVLDWHTFTAAGTSPKQTEDPVVLQVAKAHPGWTPAQVLIAWQWGQGIPINPRTVQPAHMKENLAATGLQLSASEMAALSARPNPSCKEDAWYECPTYGYPH